MCIRFELFEFSFLLILMVVVQCISCDFQGHMDSGMNSYVSCDVTRLYPYCTIVLNSDVCSCRDIQAELFVFIIEDKGKKR